jgi:hypothetical protein
MTANNKPVKRRRGKLPLFMSCREEVFSETHMQSVASLCVRTGDFALFSPAHTTTTLLYTVFAKITHLHHGMFLTQ